MLSLDDFPPLPPSVVGKPIQRRRSLKQEENSSAEDIFRNKHRYDWYKTAPPPSPVNARSRWCLTERLPNHLRDQVPITIKHSGGKVRPEMKRTVIGVCESLVSNTKPQPIEEGMGGTYLIRDRASGSPLAVFKPSDEEPCAPNNPKGLTGELGDASIKKGVVSGEQALSEVAAYLLDAESPRKARAGVPPTVLVDLDISGKTKLGSLQVFRKSTCAAGDLGPSLFSVDQVQAIAVFDMRIFNADRHDANILVDRVFDHELGTTVHNLIPIDHGCAFPDTLELAWYEWAWLSWPQAQLPLTPTLRRHVLDLSPSKAAKVCTRLNIRPSRIRTMCIATTFLQLCVARRSDLTLHAIATMMCREDEDTPSTLERLVARARWLAAVECVRDVVDDTHRTPKPFVNHSLQGRHSGIGRSGTPVMERRRKKNRSHSHPTRVVHSPVTSSPLARSSKRLVFSEVFEHEFSVLVLDHCDTIAKPADMKNETGVPRRNSP